VVDEEFFFFVLVLRCFNAVEVSILVVLLLSLQLALLSEKHEDLDNSQLYLLTLLT
jgi:hypothetical protein